MAGIRKFIKNPLGQFVVLGLVLLLINNLAQTGIIPKSLSTAVASVIIYAIIAIGFCLLMGYSGLASLGTAGFAGIGVYCAYYGFEELGFNFVGCIVLAILVAVIIGLIVGFISLRIEGMYLAILTLGLAEILFEVFLNLKQMPMVSSRHILLFGEKMDITDKYTIITVIFVLLLWLTSNLINSPTGRAMLTMKNSTSAAQAMGISLMKYRLMAFIISTVYAAIGGVLYLMLTNAVSTSSSSFLALSMSLNILGAVIVGGARSLWGTSVGVVLIFGIQSIFLINVPFFVENPEFMGFASGILLVIVVMFYPGGLYQLYYEVKGKIKKVRAKRRAEKYGEY